MTRRSWPLIAMAFTALLAVVGFSARDIVHQARGVRDGIIQVEQSGQYNQELLRGIREDTATLAIAVRDLLLDPSSGGTSWGQLEAVHQRILSRLEQLEKPAGQRQSERLRQLRNVQEQYWRMIMVPSGWTENERRARGLDFLRLRLIPLRGSVMGLSRNMEEIDQALVNDQRQRIQDSFARLDSSLDWIQAVTLGIGVLISVLTVWRLFRLESQAESLRRQTLLDHQQLRDLSQSLLRAHESERKSLARELHDQIGQMLTAIQMVFANIERGRGDTARAIEDGKSLTERTVAAVRGISMGLRPSILDDLGLGPAIEWQTREFSRRSGVQVALQLDGYLDSLSEGQSICLYRVVQEALTNCARHARAASVRVTLHVGTDFISMTIEDDGQGFDPARLPSQGLGLFGMRERVGELAGTLDILSRPGNGTLVKIQLPSRVEVSG